MTNRAQNFETNDVREIERKIAAMRELHGKISYVCLSGGLVEIPGEGTYDTGENSLVVVAVMIQENALICRKIFEADLMHVFLYPDVEVEIW